VKNGKNLAKFTRNLNDDDDEKHRSILLLFLEKKKSVQKPFLGWALSTYKSNIKHQTSNQKSDNATAT
jgi:hypothetical protein